MLKVCEHSVVNRFEYGSISMLLVVMVDDLVVNYSLCEIADFCPLGEAVFCVSDSRGVRRM